MTVLLEYLDVQPYSKVGVSFLHHYMANRKAKSANLICSVPENNATEYAIPFRGIMPKSLAHSFVSRDMAPCKKCMAFCLPQHVHGEKWNSLPNSSGG